MCICLLGQANYIYKTYSLFILCWLIQVPTINQDTGIPSPNEPSETLQKYRSGEVLLHSHKNKRKVICHSQSYMCRLLLRHAHQIGRQSIILLFGQQTEPPRSLSRSRNSHVNQKK